MANKWVAGSEQKATYIGMPVNTTTHYVFTYFFNMEVTHHGCQVQCQCKLLLEYLSIEMAVQSA